MPTVGFVFPFPLERGHLGKDLFMIPEGLRRHGFDAEVHCPSAEPGVDWPIPVVEAGQDGLLRAEHYRERELRQAIVYSFLHYSPLLTAVRDGGARIVAKGDTTGYSVVRAHPWPTLRYARYDADSRMARARAVAEWLARLGPFARRDLAELRRSLGLAQTTVVETAAAREAVRASLARAGAEDLIDRVRVIPNSVEDAFTTAEVSPNREPLVVAVGRWDYGAKDAPLLASVAERFHRQRPDHRVVVVGGGGEGIFGPAIERVGRLPQDEIVPLLNRARVVITTSHWESFSLSSHEGLAMGCSVVGPALQPLRDIVAAGPYGTIGARTPVGLADALTAEVSAWDAGLRDPLRSAAHWRGRLDVGVVGRGYAALFDVRDWPQ